MRLFRVACDAITVIKVQAICLIREVVNGQSSPRRLGNWWNWWNRNGNLSFVGRCGLSGGGLNRNTITLLYKETAQRIELDALDKLCKLFNCGVGDLLEFDDDRGK